MHHFLGIVGETGEVAELIKKVQRGSKKFADVAPELEMELTDILIYLLGVAGILGFDLEEAYNVKREINVTRFGRRADSDGI